MTEKPGSMCARRRYSAPALTLVELVTNEAVFSNCKLATTSSGPGSATGTGNCRQYTAYQGTQQCQNYLS
jgi:hypothetical protein